MDVNEQSKKTNIKNLFTKYRENRDLARIYKMKAIELRDEIFKKLDYEMGRYEEFGFTLYENKVYTIDREALERDGIDINKYRTIKEYPTIYLHKKHV